MFERIKSWFRSDRDSNARKFRSAGRTIFIGDVHGCLPELEAMIERLAPTADDRVILLGDLINRGPDSAGVVRFVAERGFECLMGNHDHEFISDPDGSPAHRELARAIGPELCEWMARRPLYIEDPKFLAVHAGVQPGVAPADTRPGILLNIRTWDGSGERLSDSNNPPWYDFYTDSRPVFYGHWARKGLNLRENTFGLDSGCVYGRSLSAYVLETQELIQIQAARTYYVPPSLRKQDNSK
ncbi:MAG: metallophosphoesterase [bacterium]|nr:metallophosphoesterase [bacterium]